MQTSSAKYEVFFTFWGHLWASASRFARYSARGTRPFGQSDVLRRISPPSIHKQSRLKYHAFPVDENSRGVF
jgi:hypothetical protein